MSLPATLKLKVAAAAGLVLALAGAAAGAGLMHLVDGRTIARLERDGALLSAGYANARTEAATAKAGALEAVLTSERETAARNAKVIEDANKRVAAAERRGRDLEWLLQAAETRAAAGDHLGPAPAGEPGADAAAGEPGSLGPIGEARAAFTGACIRDAERLSALQEQIRPQLRE